MDDVQHGCVLLGGVLLDERACSGQLGLEMDDVQHRCVLLDGDQQGTAQLGEVLMDDVQYELQV